MNADAEYAESHFIGQFGQSPVTLCVVAKNGSRKAFPDAGN